MQYYTHMMHMRLYDTSIVLRLICVFTISFALNFVWEHLHSLLYVHYQGGPITDAILFRATLGDALFITALSIPFYRIRFLSKRVWIVIPVAILGAICLELFALSTERWAYSNLMPLVPYIKTGLTPTIQLGLLGYISLKISSAWIEKTPPSTLGGV